MKGEDMWQLVQHVKEPLIAVAFLAAIIAAVVLRVFGARAKHHLEMIKSAPEQDRAGLIEATLETYHLKRDNLTKEQKFKLIRTVLQRKSERFKIGAVVLVTLTVLFGAVIVALAVIGANDRSSSRKEEFARQAYRTLFDKGASSLAALNASYDKIQEALSASYALAPDEADALELDFKNSLKQFDEFTGEVERLGTDSQIKATHSIRQWVISDYASLFQYARLVRETAGIAAELLRDGNPRGEFFKLRNKTYGEKLDELIETENQLYFAVTDYRQPVLKRLVQYFNLEFRDSMGLGSNVAIEKALAELPEAVDRSKTFKYEKKKYPYLVAEARRMVVPNITMDVEDEFFGQKDQYLKDQLRWKYLDAAIKGDPGLRELLEKRLKASK
jgi:hypothetical protein